MDTIYITGHRNPDTDSIVSAMAYAALKNALGQRQYEAARLAAGKGGGVCPSSGAASGAIAGTV